MIMKRYVLLYIMLGVGVAHSFQNSILEYNGCSIETDLDLKTFNSLLSGIGDEARALEAYCSHQKFLGSEDPHISYYPYTSSYVELSDQLLGGNVDQHDLDEAANAIASSIAWGIYHGFKFFEPVEFFVPEPANEYLQSQPFYQSFYSDINSAIYYHLIKDYSEVFSQQNIEQLFELSCAYGDPALINVLLESGKVNVDSRLRYSNIRGANSEYSIKDQDTCLIASIRNGHYSTAVDLLELGADIDASNTSSETARSLYVLNDGSHAGLDVYFRQ